MKRFRSILLNRKGESLLEVVVSLAIFSILAITVLTLITTATSINTKANSVHKDDKDVIKGFEVDEAVVSNVTYGPLSSYTLEINFGPPGADYNIKSDGEIRQGVPAREKAPLKIFEPN